MGVSQVVFHRAGGALFLAELNGKLTDLFVDVAHKASLLLGLLYCTVKEAVYTKRDVFLINCTGCGSQAMGAQCRRLEWFTKRLEEIPAFSMPGMEVAPQGKAPVNCREMPFGMKRLPFPAEMLMSHKTTHEI